MPDENTACHSVDRPYLHQPNGKPRFPFPYSRPITLLLSSSDFVMQSSKAAFDTEI